MQYMLNEVVVNIYKVEELKLMTLGCLLGK